MRTHGTLVKWNAERGFGFVAVGQGGEELFVHVSAFPRDGVPPQVGEMLSFERVSGDGGRYKAIQVQRPGARPSRKPRDNPPLLTQRQGIASSVVALGVLAAFGVFLMMISRRDVETVAPTSPAPAAAPGAQAPDPRLNTVGAVSDIPSAPVASPFRCDGRTHCSQMTSCAEAEYFLAHCPGVEMDGDGDRVPCESQWCN